MGGVIVDKLQVYDRAPGKVPSDFGLNVGDPGGIVIVTMTTREA